MSLKTAICMSLALFASCSSVSAQKGSDSGATSSSSSISGALYRQQGSTAVVTVTGYGGTPSEARNDAVRQALQRTMQQLIVTDRVIKNDSVTRDKIMSTMNGYVEGFKELEIKKDGQQIALTAEVTVSPSRIDNYIGQGIGSSGSVSGGALFAESQREITQRQVRGEIFDRLFRGFPGDVLEAKMLSIKPDNINPNNLVMTVKISFSPQWIESVRSALSAMSDNIVSDIAGEYQYERIMNSIRGRQGPGDGTRRSSDYLVNTWLAKGGASLCLADEKIVNCFLLPVGNYASSIPRYIIDPIVLLGIRFIDTHGQAVHLGADKCLVAMGLGFPNGIEMRINPADRKMGINISPIIIEATISTAEINIKDANQAVIYPFFPFGFTQPARTISSIAADPPARPRSSVKILGAGITDILSKENQNVCGDLLDDAVRKAMMMQ